MTRSAAQSRHARTRILLCDLTYTQQTISSDVMPAAVGCIATYAERELGNRISIEIFKFPESVIEALEGREMPQVIGFSNYCWNEDLSMQFAHVIKSRHPNVITVFGGPNYPTTPAEQERFLRKHPQIDFYLAKEGEIAFTRLIAALIVADFKPNKVPLDLPSVHRIAEGRFVASPSNARIRDMTEVPSPYLTGKLDKFFDGTMLPIIQTNRGCPFQCTFCVEGVDYYNKVAKTKNLEKVDAELEYIASRMAQLRADKGGRSDLHIADSNFGMYKEDLEICHSIAAKQKRYSYPEYINVATGKNHKERVLEAASVINGALRLSGSVQSLDSVVLKNIKRANIDAQQIIDLALCASKIGANSYSEIILGLPGDTFDGHMRTTKIIVEAGFNIVCLYQLMLLPGTDLASDESVERWQMITRYRAIPRCYGHYDLFGAEINACEIERICVSNDTLSFEQYLQCRKMHLIINLFYNDGVLKEVLRFLKLMRLSIYDWLALMYEDDENERFLGLVAQFLKETETELWTDGEALRVFTRKRDNIKKFIAGELGSNLIFKYRAMALVDYADDIGDVAMRALDALLRRAGASDAARDLGRELVTFGHARFAGLFDYIRVDPEYVFDYDVSAFLDRPDGDDPLQFRLRRPVVYRFVHTEAQQATVRNYMKIYGASLAGLSRILSKVYVRKLFREIVDVTGTSTLRTSQQDLRFGQAALTGLNEFG
jgi:radical SAM superfamily enzyme YgiQ (UPF0313 family)